MAEAKKKTTTKKKTAAPKEKAAPKPRKVKTVEVAPVHHEPPVAPVVHKVKKVKTPAGPRYRGTGRRKEARAKVWLTPGTGLITANGKPASAYFCNRPILAYLINRPFVVTQTTGKYDVDADLKGGGVPSQADAIRMGIARALVALNPDFKVLLKREGLMTRDPRMKERKKYGLKRARRAFQYSKR